MNAGLDQSAAREIRGGPRVRPEPDASIRFRSLANHPGRGARQNFANSEPN
jgi:hypothetical protein